jgi:hypothetical protein
MFTQATCKSITHISITRVFGYLMIGDAVVVKFPAVRLDTALITEWTPDGHFGIQSFGGFRGDRKPCDVIRES